MNSTPKTFDRSRLWLSLLALGLSSVGCTSFTAKVPVGFAEVEPTAIHAYRATSPDGVVIAIRTEENNKGADVAFWARAIENQMRLGKGYRLISQSPVQTTNAIQGQLLEFGHDEAKQPHLYRVAVFPHGDQLTLVEQGGTADLVNKNRAALDRFLSELQLD